MAMTFSFCESQLAHYSGMVHTRGVAQVGAGDAMNRVAVVTGAAAGMGLAVAQRLAAAGNHVALLDLDGDAATQAAAALRTTGVRALGARADVSDRAAVDAAIA